MTLLKLASGLPIDPKVKALLSLAERSTDRPVPLVYSYWSDTADNAGAGPTTFSSGQTAVLVESAGSHWITDDGRLTIPTPSGAAACYFSTGDVGALITHVGGRFTFSNSDPDGSAAIAITNSIIAPTGSMPSMSCHLHCTPYTWTFGVWAGADNGNTGEDVLGNGNFAFAAGMVPGYEYEMECWIVGTTAVIRLPDGSTESFTDARIASYGGNFAFCETIVGAAGDSVARWSHFWANTGLAIPGGPGVALVDGSVLTTVSIVNGIYKGANPPVAGNIMVATTGTGAGDGGDMMWSPVSLAISDTDVTDKVLTGYVSGAGTVAATDTILEAIEKLDGNDALRQPLDSDLTTIAGLTATTDNFIVSVASAWASRTPAQVRTTLGLVVGTNVQAYDADLDTWATKTAPSGTVVGTTDTQTLTNKWIQPRVNTITSSATPAINTDTTDNFTITALATAITSMTTNLTGTPVDGQRLWVRIKDNGTARAITWGASFISSGTATALTTTVINKTHLVAFMYDSAAAKWVCVASDPTGY